MKRNYPAKKWYSGKKTIFESPVGFILLVWRESRMLQYLKTFLSSGIYSHMSDQLIINATILREREAKLKKREKLPYAATSFQVVKLGDSIQTVFILLVTCLAVCLCWFIIEYTEYNRLNIAKGAVLIWVRFTTIMRKCKRPKKARRRIKVRSHT